MNNFQSNPLKLYIQDIFRANRTFENKYIYELFGLTFKNVMLHGVVTAIYNKYGGSTNMELSDPTGSIQIYYDTSKNKKYVPDGAMKDLTHGFAAILASGDDKIPILWALKNSIAKKKEEPINFQEGSYLSVIGDIFVDDLKNTRMISAYECNVTSVQNEIIWLEELRYLYEKCYLWKKE